MDIDAASLRELYTSFSTLFNRGLNNTKSHWATVAMKVPSTGAEVTYDWMDDLPGIREWLGDRLVHRLSASTYTVKNLLHELTIAVRRTKIEDDQYGFYAPLMEKMGADTARHPDDIVFDLLLKGATERCFDGQYFFDTDHIGFDKEGEEISVSNITAGAGPTWYLLDCSQPIKPLVYQERLPFKFQQLTDDKDDHVFWKDEFVYGVRGRSNAGFGLWQLAYSSSAALTPENYGTVRAAMTTLRKKNGRSMGVSPTHMVVPPVLEGLARTILKTEIKDNGGSNEWVDSVELIVTPFVA